MALTRTFVAVELDETVRATLERRIARLRRVAPGIRWTVLANLHLTLVFLGELDDEQLAAVMEATATAARLAHPFRLVVGQPGYFGPRWSPRVIWAGLGGETAKLLAAQESLARELEERGFPRDERPFAPHLTLARLKERLAPETLGALLREIETPQRHTSSRGKMRVERLSVMKSELHRPEARYTRLAEFALAAE